MKNVNVYNQILIILMCLTAIFSCSRSDEIISVKTFTYKLEVEIVSDTIDSFTSEYLLQKFGDSLQMSINDEGSIRFDFYGSGENGYDYNLFNIRNNHYYGKWKHLDTVFHHNVKSNILKLVSKNHLENQKFNSIDCEVIQYKSVDSEHPEYFVNQTFYYNKDTLKINPEKYINYKEFFFSDFLFESKCLHVKKVLEMPEYKLTYTLIGTYKDKRMNSNKFDPPKYNPLKEY